MLLSCPNGILIIHGHYDTANSTTIIGGRHVMASSDLESILSFLDSNRILPLNFCSELSDSGLSGVED